MLVKTINRFLAVFFVCCMAFAAVLPSAGATSLWSEDYTSMSLFADRKARLVGDTLTILINESSRATRSGSANNSKSGSNTLSAGTGIFHFLAAASASGSDSFNAQGGITNSNNITGKISVQVIEVKPNGNMVVSGTQSIWQNKDEHKITITGVVRKDDVTADNTVLSSLVADAQLKFDGKGPLNAKQRQGILTQIFNFIF